MPGAGGGGRLGGGLGVLSLVGLLVGVGLTVWLGSMALDLGGGGGGRRRTTTTTTVATTSTTRPVDPAALGLPFTVEVDPTSGLGDGSDLTVRVSGPAPGVSVSVSTCAAGPEADGAPTCDADSVRQVTTDPDGEVAAVYRVPRTVTVGSTSVDCAEEAGRCQLRVGPAAEPERAEVVPLSFADDVAPAGGG